MNIPELLKEQKQSLILTRALGLFFYNFKNEEIERLKKESDEFEYLWETYLNTKSASIVEHTNFYDKFFTKMSYKTQALVIRLSLENYGKEAEKSIDLTINMEEIIKKR